MLPVMLAAAGTIDHVITSEGESLRWDALVREKPFTLLVFATPWCQACRREQPEVLKWAGREADRVKTLYIYSGADQGRAAELVRERRLTHPNLVVLADGEGELADAYGIEVTPTLVLLDQTAKQLAVKRHLRELPLPRRQAKAKLARFVDTGRELGTSYDVVVVADQATREAVRSAMEKARKRLWTLEAQLSEWRDESEITRINREASQRVVPMSPAMRKVLSGALHVSQATGGAFDVTWKSVDDVWDRAAERDVLVGDRELKAALSGVGFQNVKMNQAGVRFADSKTKLGIAGVAKGYIIDAVFHYLRQKNFAGVLVNIGGDLRTAGRDEHGKMFTLRIADPYDRTRIRRTMDVENIAVATSGNYLRKRVVAGQTIGHIVDPRSGKSPSFDGSVTVLAEDAAMADALATALFVMGPDEGLAFSENTPGVESDLRYP